MRISTASARISTTWGRISAAGPQISRAPAQISAARAGGLPLGEAPALVGYFSSAEVFPSRRRATMSCWICCVPSKMSRISLPVGGHLAR
ncbi:hypothetical protein BAY61_25845 [Prauserella marina]|nr:hypothetical protein BAY61_25845 [Prauserella marina]